MLNLKAVGATMSVLLYLAGIVVSGTLGLVWLAATLLLAPLGGLLVWTMYELFDDIFHD